MKKEKPDFLLETDLDDLEWLLYRLIDRPERDRDWLTDAEAYLEHRVPLLIEEIRRHKKKLGILV